MRDDPRQHREVLSGLRPGDRREAGLSALAERCERCGGALADRQRWCLGCGEATGTALAPAPRFTAPLGAVAALATLLALAALGYTVAALA